MLKHRRGLSAHLPMADVDLDRALSLFTASTANAGAERWGIRLEIRNDNDSRTLELGVRARERGPSLVIEIGTDAYAALLERDLNAFWAKVTLSGRFSHFAVVSGALFAHLGTGQNDFAGAATRRDGVESAAHRIRTVDEVLTNLNAKHSPRATRRLAHMLRMWSDQEDFPYERDRLADYVIPDSVQRPWFDDEKTMTGACLPSADELQKEALAFTTGQEVAPDYYDASKVQGVTWGRVLLVAYDRPVPDDLRRRFPITMACLDAAGSRLLNACFLTMAPGHEILAHSDGNACYASWHMGLVVPGKCGVKAGNDVREHAPGKWLAFDDSYTHSAWNFSDRQRVVLTGWTVHPDLDDDEAAAMVDLSKLLRWGV
jgi:hypothetical protein